MIKVILCDRNFKFVNICFNLVTTVNSAKKSTYAKVCEKKITAMYLTRERRSSILSRFCGK